MEALEAVGVCRRYGKQEVLENFSLKIGLGGFDALMGPSGSGKSTFLHIASGLLAADAGRVLIGGTEVTAMSDSAAAKFRRRHIGVVFQDFNLLNEKTIAENIALPIKLGGGRVDPVRIAMLAETLGISAKLDSKPEQLSGGERQRVAIARALVAEPDIVLADEPTGNLDVANAKGICGLLKTVNTTMKGTLLVVTHDPVVAACARKVHFLKDGRIAATFDTDGDAAFIARKYLEICQ